MIDIKMKTVPITEDWITFLKKLVDKELPNEIVLEILDIVPMSDQCRSLVKKLINMSFPVNDLCDFLDLIPISLSADQTGIPNHIKLIEQKQNTKNKGKRDPENWFWKFCEAVNSDGANLIRYKSSTACWREEIGNPETTGYTGKQNRSAIDSFVNAGWGIAFGDPNHKNLGMRVIRPLDKKQIV
jgi:hypothetical protein